MAEETDIELSPKHLQAFYEKYFRYFNALGEQYKDLFLSRCLEFISTKTIDGSGEFKPDNRVKALIAASAVQLTLGLETWKLSYFETIYIHEGNFTGQGGAYSKGETNLQGYIQLSWKSFIQGYSIKDDNLNLGLHEFSHALRFNSFRGHSQDYFIEHYFDSWLASAYPAFYDTKNGRTNVFRKYGGTNINEFLSVCIEHYFESPDEIKKEYPLLYYSTGILLNQEMNGNQCLIGTRKKMFEEKNNLLSGFKTEYFMNSGLTSGMFKAAVVAFILTLCMAYTFGVDNILTLPMLSLCALFYLGFDFGFTRLTLSQKHLYFTKGLFLFKFRKKSIHPVSQIISLRDLNSGTRDVWEIIFYDSNDDYFYQEQLSSRHEDYREFFNALELNKIARFR